MKKIFFLICIFHQYAFGQNNFTSLENKLFSKPTDSAAPILDSIQVQIQKYAPKDAKAAWQKLLAKAKKQENPQLVIQIYLEAYHYFFSTKRIEEGLQISSELILYMKSSNLGVEEGEVYLALAELCRHNYLDDKALEYYHKALEIFKKYNDPKNIYQTYYGIGDSFFKSNPKKAREYMLTAIHYKNHNPHPSFHISSLNTIALTYQHEADTTNALLYFDKALQMAIKQQDREWEGIISGNIGQIFNNKKEHEKALLYLYKELSLVKERKNKAETYFAIAKIYTKLNELPKAKMCLDSGLVISEHATNIFLLKNKYEALHSYYEKKQDFSQAYQVLKQLNTIEDSIISIKQVAKFEKIEIQNEFEKQETKIAYLEEKTKLQSQNVSRLQWLIAIVLLSAGVLSAFMYFLYKYSQNIKHLHSTLKTSHTEILEKNTQLHKQQADLANLNATLALEVQLKQQLIESKNKELLNYALIIAENNDFLEDLKNSILDTASLKTQETKQLLSKIESVHDKEKDWQAFKRMFDAVNPDFFKSLITECLDLSAQELKLCALIKLNISSKEIASILRIAPESVYKARYRIRKKMNMDSENKLNDFLFKI